jgi:hypothetical protein
VTKLESVSDGPGIPKTQYPRHVLELEKQMQNLCVSANDIQKQQAILDTLSFDSRTIRHQAIPEAHPGTFQWALSTEELEEDGRQDAIRLLHWLQHGEGIFWVTGRPGSGKSTFMKHIADGPDTRAALRQWSNPFEPVISSHYFWIFGTPMQKSKEGLLRTLLYEIFCQYPALLRAACPVRWESDFSSSAASKPWSTTELREVLDLVTSLGTDIKICFFIDGLDEYSGDHLEVSEELLRLSTLKNIKFCISSRPWNVFHDAFGYDRSQHLCLDNITKRDIRQYVHDRLTSHPRWQRLVDHTLYDNHLIEYVTDKSHGVFLWVSLVTDRLRNGLTNDDDLSDLSGRLARFPSDLENFFDHILQTVEPFYHEKMAGTLRLARAAERPLHILSYEFHDAEYPDEEDVLHTKGYQLDRGREKSVQKNRVDRRMNASCRALWHNRDQCETEVEKAFLQARVQRRLNAYCKGLLEVQDDRVEFLHRTVADYLSIPNVSERLSTQSAEWFHPELSLAKVHLSWVQILPHAECCAGSPLDDHVRAALALASLYDAEKSVLRDKFRLLLYDMESSLTASSSYALVLRASRYFRKRLLQSRLPNYVEKMLILDTEYFENFDHPPLAAILEEGCPSQHVRTIQLLLEHGQDPNYEFVYPDHNELSRKKTPWTVLVSLLVRQTRDGLASRLLPFFSDCLRAGVFDLFLQHGADRNASVYRREGQPHTTAWIDILFACFEIEKRDQEHYLRVLGQLLQGKISVEGVIPMGPESATNVEPVSETILKRFFQLAQVLEYSTDFVIRVSEHLVRKACRAGWSLGAVWPEMRLALGDAKAKHLRTVYNAESKLRMKERLFIGFSWGNKISSLVRVDRRGTKR